MTDAEFRKRSRVILRNLIAENYGFWRRAFGRRWKVDHETLRADARRLLELEASTDPFAELRGSGDGR